MARVRRSAAEERARQITLRLDDIRSQLATKTRDHYADEETFQRQRRRVQELADELEAELSVLRCPGEYNELPVAIVADELGLTYRQVRNLIKSGEIEAAGRAAHERVSREELARVAGLGPAELLRLASQESAEIFEEAAPRLQEGDVEYSERALRRLNARGGWQEAYAPAFIVGLEIVKREFDSALSSVRLIYELRNPLKRAAALACLGRLLKGMKPEGGDVQSFRERLLRIVESGSVKAGIFDKGSLELSDDKAGEIQRHAMYLAAAVRTELRKYQSRHKYAKRESSAEIPYREFNLLLRDILYTALYAEASYDESAVSRAYVEVIKKVMPAKYRPAVLLITPPMDEE